FPDYSITQFHRSSRIGRPFAPRSRVQLRAADARMFEREQVVACRHARSAVTHDTTGRHVAETRAQVRAQIFRRSKQTALVDVRLKEMIRGARNVAGDFIERLDVAAIALGRAGIDESP